LPARIIGPLPAHHLSPISNVMRVLARAIRGKIGWSSVAIALSVVIMAVAAVTLVKLFREIQFGAVVAALRAQSPHRLAVAAGFVVAGYALISCYDVFALRAIDRPAVPYRVAAFASFASYTIGHNFGATVFTSGVIRYRIYSVWGLSVSDIARIAFITGLTYWLGNSLVLGGGFAYAPEAASAIDHLPPLVNRLIGIAAIAAVAAYLVWLFPRRRVIGRANWRVVLPTPRGTLVQIAIGALDLTFVSLAMYALLPPTPPIGVLHLIVVFVAAMLIGVLSYAPGSLGVIEAAMFIALPQFGREELLAALLTFRVLYFIVPLLISALLVGLREFRLVLGEAISRAL
jgi:uncharacterized membrane protein YbhN (UPF0104 family)